MKLGFFDMTISDSKMSKIMYALIKTDSKLVSSFSPSIKGYTRKQSSGFSVQMVIEIKQENLDLFEELAEVKLKSSDEFQGKLTTR